MYLCTYVYACLYTHVLNTCACAARSSAWASLARSSATCSVYMDQYAHTYLSVRGTKTYAYKAHADILVDVIMLLLRHMPVTVHMDLHQMTLIGPAQSLSGYLPW